MVKRFIGMPVTMSSIDTKEAPGGANLSIRPPDPTDGADMWRLAKDSGTLDRNSSYAYLLFGRDFSRTSRVAAVGKDLFGFVLGYLRPEFPDHLFIWQIAVDERARGEGIAGRLLDDIVASNPEISCMETTITHDNVASKRLFESFARHHGASIESTPLFREHDFPDDHETESLYVISGIG